MNKILYLDTVDSILSTHDIAVAIVFSIGLAVFVVGYGAFRFKDEKLIFFILGFSLKLITSILFVILTKYYFQGDTMMFFTAAKQMATSDFGAFLDFMFTFDPSNWKSSTITNLDGPTAKYMFSLSNNLVARFAAIPSVLLFYSFTATSIFFGFVAFLGTWKLFIAISRLFPYCRKELAVVILLLPSVLYWANGLLKESICIYFIGILTKYIIEITIVQRINFLNILRIVIATFFLFCIKPYIIISFYFSMFLVLMVVSNESLRKLRIRRFFRPLVLLFFGVLVFFINNYILFSSRFSANNILNSINSHQRNSSGSSYFSLGEFEPTILGLITFFPKGINAALFRPYLWEIKSIVMLMASVENSFFLLVVIILLVNIGPLKILRICRSNPFLSFCLIFTIVFSGLVGMATYNFGTLIRYRIPCVPFFGSLIVIIFKNNVNQRKLSTKLKSEDFG